MECRQVVILSTHHTFNNVPLATWLGWVTAKEVTNLTENKKGEKILHAFHRKILSTKILNIKNIIMCFDMAKSYFSPQNVFKVNRELYRTYDLSSSETEITHGEFVWETTE